MIVLDTTAFSAAMRHEPEIIRFLEDLRPGDVATVPPVVAEIEYGIQRLDVLSKKYSLLASRKDWLLAGIQVLAWDSIASKNFGRIKAGLEKAGTPIDDFDTAIAAIAMSHAAEVITANLTHFGYIPELSFRHWK